MLRQKGLILNQNNVKSLDEKHVFISPLWAAGFNFSESSVLIEVPYDPLLPQLFFGEELSMAAR
jgi:hypothetical protein